MACSILSRLFNHGPLRRLHYHAVNEGQTPPSTVSSPVLTGSNVPLTDRFTTDSHPVTTLENSSTLILLYAMAGTGTTEIIVRNVILDATRSIDDLRSPYHYDRGYISMVGSRHFNLDADRVCLDIIFTFRTATEAMNARIDKPMVWIEGTSYPPDLYDDDLRAQLTGNDQPQATEANTAEPAINPLLYEYLSPPRKRQKKERADTPEKITCKICFDELQSPYSTPCRRCKAPECYDCLTQRFRTALKDFDRMPVTCCGCVMHFDVARGILPAAELEEYKLKYDERMNAINPLYCPIPTCSTFIPSRTFKEKDRKVDCPVCCTAICTKCKQEADAEHTSSKCQRGDPRKTIVDTFKYKLCPRCGNGVMKMYGCPHVRCHCGAHWCWECERSMNACYAKPCRAAREEGNNSDGAEEDADSDDELAHSQDHALPSTETPTNDANVQVDGNETPTMGDTTDPGVSAPVGNGDEVSGTLHTQASATNTDVAPPANLDDPEERDWEYEDLDFGEEPADEPWDAWGCQHKFYDFGKECVPQYWMVGVSPANDFRLEIECMGCFKKAVVWDDSAELEKFRATNGISGDLNLMTRTMKLKWIKWKQDAALYAASGTAALQGFKPQRPAPKSQCVFECKIGCGVIYCGDCKGEAKHKVQQDRRQAH